MGNQKLRMARMHCKSRTHDLKLRFDLLSLQRHWSYTVTPPVLILIEHITNFQWWSEGPIKGNVSWNLGGENFGLTGNRFQKKRVMVTPVGRSDSLSLIS
jgi:hypothetical protein